MLWTRIANSGGVKPSNMTSRLFGLVAAAALVALSVCPERIAGQMTYTKLCKGLELTQLDYADKRDVDKLNATLTEMLGGCEYIHGDLVLKGIGVDDRTGRILDDRIHAMETDFLDSVVEISGRLILIQIGLRRVRLKNLRAIRGSKTTDTEGALEVAMCVHPMELQLPSLRAIVRGDVHLFSTMDVGLFCRLRSSIDWSVVFQSPQQKLRSAVTGCTRGSEPISNCSCEGEPPAAANCSSKCAGGRCWSPDVCQASGRCSRQRPCTGCYRDDRTGDEECCDRECLGGCSGPGPKACHSCARVLSDGECRQSCPPRSEYNSETMQLDVSKEPMVTVGNVCEKRCPTQFVLDSSRQFCLAACPMSETPVEGSCTKCGEFGDEDSDCSVCSSFERAITDAMAERFANCSVWQFAKTVSLDGSSPGTSSVSLSALGSARYLYVDILRITRTQSLAANLSALRSLRHMSGDLILMDLQASFLGLSSLETSKKLTVAQVKGLCRAWYPERFLSEGVSSKRHYPVSTRDIAFAADSDPACIGAVCDPLCRDGQCWGPGPGMCVACTGVRVKGICHKDCAAAGGYPNPAAGTQQRAMQCLPCHQECGQGGCSGPKWNQCVRCRNFKEDGACVASCGSQLEPGADGVCYAAAAARFAGLAAGLALLVLAMLVLGFLGWRYYQRRVHKYDMVELDEYLADPSNPGDMVKLLIVNDDDIVKQKEIGSGAFGTVFKGQLRTDTVKGVRELPVAIKVLRGNNPKLGQELLNEASVLARVQHPHCVRLVALCMTAEVQLITALMPRGCLLSFLRDHHDSIGAERMLSWALQVAEGMAYLESINIVHRDLAARNVLLKSLDEVKITDFGLARLLQEDEREILYTSGALPVKWLGIECFESGVFSHKSDVWSYGVLLWEVCSYGEAPYKPYRIASVEDITGLLRKGIRLNQPDICSVDFYNIMLSCWLPYPDSRPTFSDLTATMKDCLLCPSKFIASRAGMQDQMDLEKAELIHAMVQHRTLDKTAAPPQPGEFGDSYADMGADAAFDAHAKTAVAAGGSGAPRCSNAYVSDPCGSQQHPQQQQQYELPQQQPATPDDYLVPQPAPAPPSSSGDDTGYLVPSQLSGPRPVDIDDDYLCPTKY